MAVTQTGGKSPAMISVSTLMAGGGLALFGGLIGAMVLWAVAPATARETRAACGGLRGAARPPRPLCQTAGSPDCQFPLTAPDFTVKDKEGKAMSLASLRGQVVLVNFWASWCDVCASEKGSLAAFAAEHQDQIKVVSLASDAAWAPTLAAIVRAMRPDLAGQADAAKASPDQATALYAKTFPQGTLPEVFLDPPVGDSNIGQIATAWGVKAVPESFLIDRQGRVRAYYVNKRDWQSDVAETCMQALIDE